MSDKISRRIVNAVVCLLALAAGCGQTATLALRFNPQDLTTYKITTEAEDSIKYEGSLLKNAALEDKCNHNRLEMTFSQQVQSTDDKDNALVNITIEGLKCLIIYQNNSVLDFDSSRENDSNNPLKRLVGQNYTIQIAPTGKVVKVIDTNEARIRLRPSSLPSSQRALMLFSDDAIKKRHTVQALPANDRNKLHIGSNWSNINTFSFRQMGSKSYQRIYTLKKIKNINNRQLAIIEMNAIPTSGTVQELQEEQPMGLFSNMFDNIETYTGQLRFDLTAGRIEKYLEELQTEWIIADPKPKDDEEVGLIRMRAVRSHSLEKVNR